MNKCGKSFLPECEYFATSGCISPFNCPYKIEHESITTATSTPLNSNVIYTDEADKDKEIARLTEENERLKEKVKELDIVEKTTYRVLFRLMKITFWEHGIDDNEVHERIKELLREAEREILREAQEERK